MSTFTNKVAVITGGNSGIGLAAALELARRGAKVVIAGRDDKSLAGAAQAIGGDVLAVRADVSNLSDLDAMYAKVKAKYGHIDVLFANAGIAKFAPADQTDEAFYDQMMDINVKGVFFTVAKAIPLLRDGGAVVTNTSMVSRMGMSGSAVYSATKAAVRSLTRTFAAELVGRNIRVNAVAPGPIATPIYGKLGLPQEAVDGLAAGILSMIPMKRFGTPEEIAKAVAFLASDDASYITGVELSLDGGKTQL